ncbi:VTT domain-containing protein [bacterium]|nr:VTT domain-containing protein [bacterium]
MSKSSDQKKAKKKLGKDIIRVLLIAAIFALAAILLRHESVRANLFNIEHIRDTLNSTDSVGGRLKSYFLFILVSAPLVVVGMPRIWISVVAGSVFGALVGIPVALIASVIGCLGTYLVGRSMLASMIRRRFGKRVKMMRERFRENAFFWTLYFRLFPFSNATLTGLLCGTCKVNMRSYVLASAIGFTPMTIIFAVFGSGAAKANSLQIGLGIVLFLGSILLQRMLSPRMKLASERHQAELARNSSKDKP